MSTRMKKKLPAASVTRTPVTPLRRAIMAAVLGFTNTGQPNPTRQEIEQLFRDAAWREQRWGHVDLDDVVDSAMTSLCQGLCESDEMLDNFLEEARWWYTDKEESLRYEEEVRLVWPDVAALFEGLPTPEVTR